MKPHGDFKIMIKNEESDGKEIIVIEPKDLNYEFPKNADGKEYDESIANDIPHINCPFCNRRAPISNEILEKWNPKIKRKASKND